MWRHNSQAKKGNWEIWCWSTTQMHHLDCNVGSLDVGWMGDFRLDFWVV